MSDSNRVFLDNTIYWFFTFSDKDTPSLIHFDLFEEVVYYEDYNDSDVSVEQHIEDLEDLERH